MHWEILRPLSLLLLAFLPLFWWWHRRSLAPLRGKRQALALTVRSVVFVLLVLALTEPRWLGTTQEKEVFFVVDRSASVEGEALPSARNFAAAADPLAIPTAWLGFAGQAQIFPDLATLEEAPREVFAPNETRLDRVLALASASFHPGKVKTVILFSDGVPTAGTVDPEGLKREGIRLHTVPVSPPDRAEVLVREVRAPGAVRAHEPVSIEAVIQSSRDALAEVDLFRNGVRIASRPMRLQSGSNEVRFDDRAGEEKLLHYEVAVSTQEDTLAENNQTGAAVISEGVSKVMLLTDRPESARYLEWALRQEGIQLGVRPSHGAPTQMSDLQNFDAVILDNIPASDLTRQQMELLQSYVRDFGGGLVMLGGDQAYGLGGYFRTPIEDVLPVQCDFQKEEETPSLALSLVIDRSGSMQGENIELAKAAAKASADLLGPRDYISVIAFDTEVHSVTPLQSAGNHSSVAADIASITPGGGTDMAPGMEEALRQLSGSAAKLKHVILLTDGASQPGPFQELANQMVQNNITVSTVAMGEGADRDLLNQIAQWGNGRYYEATDVSTVPQIFTKETITASKSAIQEFPFLAKPVRAVDFLEGVPWSSAPFLLGYVRTKVKPTAETWLVTERGDPLLCTWRFGLGTAAAFTSDARNRWAIEWLRWNGFGKFWAQFLRRISRPLSLGLSELVIEQQGVFSHLTLDALDAEQGFPENVTASVRLAKPNGKVQVAALEKLQPGRWQGKVPTEERGIYSGQILLERDGVPMDTRFFTITRGFSAEFLLEPVNARSLKEMAVATGGDFNPNPASVFRDDTRTARQEKDLWPWLALLALLFFILDVGIRRWPD